MGWRQVLRLASCFLSCTTRGRYFGVRIDAWYGLNFCMGHTPLSLCLLWGITRSVSTTKSSSTVFGSGDCLSSWSHNSESSIYHPTSLLDLAGCGGDVDEHPDLWNHTMHAFRTQLQSIYGHRPSAFPLYIHHAISMAQHSIVILSSLEAPLVVTNGPPSPHLSWRNIRWVIYVRAVGPSDTWKLD